MTTVRLIANSLNGRYPVDLVLAAKRKQLTQIDLAVAYVGKMDDIFQLASETGVPLTLYALADGHGFPNLGVARRFIEGSRIAWRLYLTRDYFHPKVMWFRGVGAYIGSANLTDKAWYQNIECGIWIPQDELDETNWTEELSAIFSTLRSSCREATSEDLELLQRLRDRRRRLDEAEREFEKERDRLLAHLPGDKPPIDVTKGREKGGAAKAAFLAEWNQGLTILRKLTRRFDENRDRWPPWVDRSAAPAIVQDQATEWWWDREFRRSGESRRLMAEAHERNSVDPDRVVRELLASWRAFDGGGVDGTWHLHVNENPRELHRLLSEESLARLDKSGLARILFLCHASREHARQIRNPTLGLPSDAQRSVAERVDLYADYLWRQRTAAGRSVVDVLRFVLWGDQAPAAGAKECAGRIWSAANDDDWRLPHLGIHILGEMVGYARPDDFPPRNNRVSKTLFALGFKGVTYY